MQKNILRSSRLTWLQIQNFGVFIIVLLICVFGMLMCYCAGVSRLHSQLFDVYVVCMYMLVDICQFLGSLNMYVTPAAAVCYFSLFLYAEYIVLYCFMKIAIYGDLTQQN